MIFEKLPKRIISPPLLVESSRYFVKLAETADELKEVQRLRYRVFNEEQKRGLKTADVQGIDSDEFDEYCLHLMVREKTTGETIGTYRAQIGTVANSAKGFYTSREFDLKGLDKISDRCLELGRSCVSLEHRHGAIIALLWYAISELLVRTDSVYMLGCVSLDTTDPLIGWSLHEYLMESNNLSHKIKAVPRPEFRLERPPAKEITRALLDTRTLKTYIPPLFKAYIRVGASICGEPALDEEFGTIDFCILVDVGKIPYRYVKHFKYPAKAK